MIRRGALFLLFAGRSLALSADDGALDLTFGGDASRRRASATGRSGRAR